MSFWISCASTCVMPCLLCISINVLSPKSSSGAEGLGMGQWQENAAPRGPSRWYNLRARLCTKLCRPSAASASFLSTLLWAQREEPTTLAWALASLWAEGWRCVQRTQCRTMPLCWCPELCGVPPSFLPPARRWISQVCSLWCCIYLYFHLFCFVSLRK